MAGKTKKRYRQWLTVGVVAVFVCAIILGGIGYVENLRKSLRDNAVQNLMAVTVQQQQDFDTFLSRDREQLHKIAGYFNKTGDSGPEEGQRVLSLFQEPDSIYLLMCLDEGWICGTSFEDVRQLDEENLELYRSLGGSGVRDAYRGLYSGTPRFCYYESFEFGNGHVGLVQKSYDRSRVSETFSLSFYNDQGFAYIVNSSGEILVRSAETMGDQQYENIFDILTGTNAKQRDIDTFAAALESQEAGSITFTGDMGEFIYTYVSIENVEDWYLVSIVPESAIWAESGRILLDSQIALGALILMMAVCSVLVALILRSHRELSEKEREIEYQEKFFDIFAADLASNTNDVYMMLDQETAMLEYVSPNVERVMGVGAQDLVEYLQASDEAIYAEAMEIYYQELRRIAPGEGGMTRATERTNPVTGERKYFLENAYCTEIQGRRKLMVYISDRTKERKIQDSLAEALKMAQAANDAKSAFLSNVSHDIRTPMNAIIGFLALMKEEAEDPRMVREYAQRIDAASQHLLGLINDVLDMNKIESGSATLNISEMNLAEVIDEINNMIRPQARDKNQSFEIFASRLSCEHVLGDKLRINQVLINLLSNAVKYTPEGGSIQMRVEELPQVVENYSRVRFSVSDNGLGMSEDYLKVIFDPFTREETKATRGIQGTGLGMAITKSLVDLMGGTIRVESKLGEGSTFTVELELCIQEREDDAGFWDEYKVARMLVTDDDEEICRNIVRAMARTGVETEYATDGETAVQMMRSNREAGKPYDLILLDWKMPKLDGMETARLIRKNYPEKIPILLLSAYDWSDIEQEAREIGVSHFMPKPFFMSTFKEAIRRVMGSRREEAEESQADRVVRGRHVLVVDDIEVNRIILVKILTTLGAVCDTAGDGREAVEKFEASQPGEYDLIMMDVQMPIMNGYEATRAIRGGSHPGAKSVPIIAMTANAFVDDVRDAIESGMDAHIAKPVQMDKLRATIQQMLDSRAEQGQASGST